MSGQAGGRAHADFDKERARMRAQQEEAAFAAREQRAGGSGGERDTTPAVGSPGAPARWERAEPGARVALHIGEWRDGRWSYLYGEDTRYGAPSADGGLTARGARDAEAPKVVGPMIHAPVWTWEVPLYFWFGGIAAGSSFVALACDLAGDERAAAVARKVALGAVIPSPALLVMDLGRPARFLNMLRIVKVRSPMSLGAWCLVTFSQLAAADVAADLLGRRKAARAIGAANAVVGGYLGSYTGVLLASTAVPLWARSRLMLGPIFVATATATGAAAVRLAIVATGTRPAGHPTRHALGTVETVAMGTELALSVLNERRLGELATGLEEGRPGRRSGRRSGSCAAAWRCGWRAAGLGGQPTTWRASCTSWPGCSSATPGWRRGSSTRATTRSWRRWPASRHEPARPRVVRGVPPPQPAHRRTRDSVRPPSVVRTRPVRPLSPPAAGSSPGCGASGRVRPYMNQ